MVVLVYHSFLKGILDSLVVDEANEHLRAEKIMKSLCRLLSGGVTTTSLANLLHIPYILMVHY